MSQKEEDIQEDLARYYPERDYIKNNYQPFGKPFDDLCKNCEVYSKFLHEKGLKKTPETPTCMGHVMSSTKYLDPSDFEEDEYHDLMINMDPVSWAAHTFDWNARWYQAEIMSCTALRKVVRAGRRVGKTLAVAVLALWRLATMPDQSVLIIAPFEAQVEKIFDEIIKFISMSSALSASVVRKTKKPCRLEFSNGSKALGFSSGNHSGSGSDKIRGQDATYIVIDEADYINEKDVEAILAILASHPDCGLWASSTPTGKHGKFYQFAVSKDLGFKEFWYISAEAPNWTPDVESFFRNSYDSTTYEHEFYAEFGLQEAGVFRNDLIDNALENYSLPRKRIPGSRICVGVDWNGQAIGTHIVITEVVEVDGQIKYIPIDKQIIKGGEFTQQEGVQALIDIDKKYNPDFIYVDAGFGEVQVEMLRKYGKTTVGSKLHKKVKPYTMGGNIEIRDPVNGSKEKKPAKPFMVNVAVMQLEEKRCVLPLSEDTAVISDTMDSESTGSEQGFVQQMRNFSIERYTPTGAPQYSQDNDHTLTAWMLSLVAFVLEFSDLRRRNSYIRSRLVGQPGQSPEEAEDHASIILANALRRLDKDTVLPQNHNIGSVGQAIQQGEKLKDAFKSYAGRKYKDKFVTKRQLDRTSKFNNKGRGLDGPGGRKSF